MIIWNGAEYAQFYKPATVIPAEPKRLTRQWITARNESIAEYARLIEQAKRRFAADPRFPGAAFAVAPPPLEMPEWTKGG